MREDGTLLDEGTLRIMKAQVTRLPKNIEAISIDFYAENPLATRTPVSEGSLGEWYRNRGGKV